MKKNIIKRFRCNEKEARILKEKSKLVGLNAFIQKKNQIKSFMKR